MAEPRSAQSNSTARDLDASRAIQVEPHQSTVAVVHADEVVVIREWVEGLEADAEQLRDGVRECLGWALRREPIPTAGEIAACRAFFESVGAAPDGGKRR